MMWLVVEQFFTAIGLTSVIYFFPRYMAHTSVLSYQHCIRHTFPTFLE